PVRLRIQRSTRPSSSQSTGATRRASSRKSIPRADEHSAKRGPPRFTYAKFRSRPFQVSPSKSEKCRRASHAFRYSSVGGASRGERLTTQRQKKDARSVSPRFVAKPFGTYRSGQPSFCRSKNIPPQLHPPRRHPASPATSLKCP